MNTVQQYYKLKDDIRTDFIKYFYSDEDGEDAYLDYLDDRDIYWIGNGNVLGISDIFINLEDIIYVLEHGIDRWILLDWYWETLENPINLPSYIKIRADWTHEDFLIFQEHQEKKRNDPEYKAQVDAEMKKIWDEWVEKLNKYIK